MSTLSTVIDLTVGDKERSEDLRSAIDQAEPGSLLMSMVHVAGDLSLLDEFEGKLAASLHALKIDAEAATTHYGASSGARCRRPDSSRPR
ncbi:conserved hypothetical protein (plasmid) [Rhodococcus jostii RHA1]|uniref:Uncharacterized protein n=1 Tax=Rhodococcus jostii (strain RHA1) TaxID=101510 RepID=Q0RXE2_RHOJR|nr:conserved hypothetical protein [Rhodococcus jostii RHA1]